ncbi:hypothetical protein ACIPZF_19335 [Pseudomonas sp. NPDC089752]|uniref:hypothetical protein n=1 Tax=Pseudomonas sp. NPDC089752 TaxID=3364472 RepID=UPI003805D819
MFRSLSPALFATAFITLAGCQSAPVSKEDEQKRQSFINDMQRTLIHSMATADTGEQIGAVLLEVKLDRQSAPTSCKAIRAPVKYQMALPAGVMATDIKALTRMVEAQCWKTIYPVAPAAMREEDGTVHVLAPLYIVLPRSEQAPGTLRRKAYAQRDFFWEHLLRDQPVTSIGTASLYYQANAQGKVEGCLVQLYPHPLRKDAFKLDGNLQAQLNSRCMALDLSKLPGFEVDEQGLATGYSEMNYAPWRVNRP